jgi:uncharacterized integral membrane protein
MFGRSKDTATATTDAGTASTTRNYNGTGVWPAVILGLVLAVALVVFVAQNGHAVRMHWLWLHFRTSPAVLVLVTAVAAIAAAIVVGALWRHGRRRILNEREELAHLRRTVHGTTEPDVDVTDRATADERIDVSRDAPRTMRS